MKNGDMPAFGTLERVGEVAIRGGGLTKREYFAAKAMQGLLVNVGRNGYEADFNLTALSISMADLLLDEIGE